MADFSASLAAGSAAAFDALASAGRNQPGNKLAGAARDFEALLISEVFKSSHGGGSWLGTSDHDAGSEAVSFGEEQLAQAIAAGGGLGLSDLIESGIARAPDPPASNHGI
jgi:Rod binding domain-containing protein